MAFGFDDEAGRREKLASRLGDSFRSANMATPRQGRKRAALLSRYNSGDSSEAGRRQAKNFKLREVGLDETANAIIPSNKCPSSTLDLGQNILALPDEILLIMFSELPDQDLWAVAKVFPVTNEILNSYDFIRLRELQCFWLEESFMKVKLGVGVPSIVEGVRTLSEPNSISSRNKRSETMG